MKIPAATAPTADEAEWPGGCLIPRGPSLIKAVIERATVPVIETGVGNCHVYVDSECDQDMAVNITVNAKSAGLRFAMLRNTVG